MNKITSILAGLAIVATASVAPAMAGGLYINPSATSTFVFNPGSDYSLLTTPAEFIPFGPGGATFGTLTLDGTGFEAGTTFVFDATTLTFAPTGGGATITEHGKSALTFSSAGNSVSVTNVAPTTFSGSGHSGDYLNLSAPVPEASTVVSFGALLALGGLVVLRRKSAKNAA